MNIRDAIVQGTSEQIEFKSTLHWDVYHVRLLR